MKDLKQRHFLGVNSETLVYGKSQRCFLIFNGTYQLQSLETLIKHRVKVF